MHQSVHFHIEQNDYFGTLATVLDLLRQDLNRGSYYRHAETLGSLCDELMYLQGCHRIESMEAAGATDEDSAHQESNFCDFVVSI